MTISNRLEIPCAQCGEKLQLKPSVLRNSKHRRFYCNSKCMGLWRSANLVGEASPKFKPKITVQCAVCGKLKEVHESQTKGRRVFFCSEVCKGKWHREHQTGKRRNWVEIACARAGCGKPVQVVQSRAKMYKAQFCSNDSRATWRSANTTGQSNPNHRGGSNAPCHECGTPVWVKPSDADSKHFCSRKCFEKSDSMTGPGSAAWRGGTVRKNCLTCGNEFEVKQVQDRNGALFCSKKCWGAAARQKAADRVWSVEELTVRSLNRSMGTAIHMALGENKAGRHWETLVGYSLSELQGPH